jgi:hypothetical protein
MPAQNPWAYWFDEEPRAAFEALRPQQGSFSFLDYWRNQFPRLQSDFMGAQGREVLAGRPPSLEFPDYLTDYPWMNEWLRLSPQARGSQAGRLNPRTRWIF